MASRFIAENHGGPTLRYALLFGMAFHFLASEPRTAPRVAFAGRTVLRLGVALLGMRIGLEDILALDFLPIVTALAAMTAAGFS
jgi:uncharacterized membrane protein YadS